MMTKYPKAQGPSKYSGSDNGGTRDLVYLGFPAETFPQGAAAAFLASSERLSSW